jgi:di/tricarboxylate transporter
LVIIVSAILVIAIVLLVTEVLPVDLTALGIIAALMVLGILEPPEALAGFANPAPVTVAALFAVSRGLMRSGALDFITERVMRYSAGKPGRLLFISLFLVGGFSSFLNNTPVVVLFISVTMAVCSRYSLSPSKFLMPISFVSILAGTSTLIGTSTNILVSDLAAQNGLEPIAMFELSLLGMPMAMLGALFLFFLSPRILGSHKEAIYEVREGERSRYISELLIEPGSPLEGRTARAAFDTRYAGIELFEIIRGQRLIDPRRQEVEIEAGDILLVKATAQQLTRILADRCAILAQGPDGTVAKPYDRDSVFAELLVQPNSLVIGRALSSLVASLDSHVKVIGVKRHWKHYPARKFRDLRLALGDIILVQSPLDHLEQIRATGDLLVIEDVHKTLVNYKKTPLATGIFLAMILVTTLGILDILVASLAALLLMVLTGCLSLREAYRSIDVRVLVLIVGTIALGTALTGTGAADLYAVWFLKPLADASPQVVLSALILLTSLLSMFISNNSTAVLMLPIALSTAAGLEVDPRPFVIGICFGASACYATPIGYQTNLLVYGPGGYRFRDYLKLGIPLNIFVWITATIFVPILWPF